MPCQKKEKNIYYILDIHGKFIVKKELVKMKILCAMALAFFLLIGNISLAAAAPIPLRGIVEGFYGTPWSQADRLDMLRFCQREGLNAYIYAPKDDPYHRAKWREPYPPEKLAEMSRLIEEAKASQVRFIFAVSPGLDIHFRGTAGERDKRAMREKLTAMYELGVRDFAIFFDDIENKDGKGQAAFLNWLEENFVKTHQDIAPLLTVPTEYFREDMLSDGQTKTYTEDFSTNLNKDIMVLYTGEKVVPDGLTDEDYQKANKLYHRQLGLWWNYPVSDYLPQKLALGPIEKLPRQEKLPAIFFNPMQYAGLSKISLITGAKYAKNPERYNAHKAWKQALKKEYGHLAPDMERFADHSQHMKVSWAEIGPEDGQKMRSLADAYWQARQSGRKHKTAKARRKLTKELKQLDKSLNSLMTRLPPERVIEFLPQLDQLRRIVKADLLGLSLLSGEQDKAAAFEEVLAEVKANDAQAIISEKSARALLTEIDEARRQSKSE